MCASFSFGVMAQDSTRHGVHRIHFSPEQKAEMEARQAEFEKMTPEEKAKFRAEHHAMREERLKNMTPEQKAKFEARKKEHHRD